MKTEINGKTVYPLSIAQKELLYEEISIDKNSAFVNVLSFHIRVDEGFDADAMTKAFTTLVERNDALRLHIFKKGFSYYQYVADTVPETLPVEECGDREGFDRALAEYLKTHVKMTDECLYRAKIFRTCSDPASRLL